MEKHNSLESNTLKMKKKLTILENYLPKTFEKSSPKPNKSKINNFLVNTRTPLDLFIDNLVEGKETLVPYLTQIFTPKEAIKQELELRNFPLVNVLRFNGNPVHRQVLS